MRKLSQYAPRYGELRATRSNEARGASTIGSSDLLTDVSDFNSTNRKIRVHCYPNADGRSPRWRSVGENQVVILPLLMKVQSHESVKLKHCEIHIVTQTSGLERSNMSVAGEQQSDRSACDKQSVCLYDVPRPISEVKADDAAEASKSWRFRSNAVPDEHTRRLTAASWEWLVRSPVGHDPHPQLGAVAISHSGEPFRIGCHVHGTASKFPFQYVFGSSPNQSRLCDIIPPKERPYDVREKRNLKAEIDDLMKEEQLSITSATRKYGAIYATGSSSAVVGDYVATQNIFYNTSA